MQVPRAFRPQVFGRSETGSPGGRARRWGSLPRRRFWRTPTITLVYIRALASSGSQGGWAARKEIAHRISFETQGFVTRVQCIIIEGESLCNFLGTTREQMEENYRHAWYSS